MYKSRGRTWKRDTNGVMRIVKTRERDGEKEGARDRDGDGKGVSAPELDGHLLFIVLFTLASCICIEKWKRSDATFCSTW